MLGAGTEIMRITPIERFLAACKLATDYARRARNVPKARPCRAGGGLPRWERNRTLFSPCCGSKTHPGFWKATACVSASPLFEGVVSAATRQVGIVPGPPR